jgi:hypothetical protein
MLPYDMNHAIAQQRMESLHREASNHRRAKEAGLLDYSLGRFAIAIRHGYAELKAAASRSPEFNGPVQPVT